MFVNVLGRVTSALIVLLIIVGSFSSSATVILEETTTAKATPPKVNIQQFTIRVNTFRRNDMLEQFLDFYHKCPLVKQIQIVWSDTKASPPVDWLKKYNHRNEEKVIFEVHKNNSLSNRFRPLVPIDTDGILSIDDDIFIPCEELQTLFNSWTMNRRVLVGVSPRLNTHHPITGESRYLNWQYTWWNGEYTIVLTKASMMHKDYLYLYDKIVPPFFLKFIDENRNCEDIAMAYVVARVSRAAPVWASTIYYDIPSQGISSQTGHFQQRSYCVEVMEALMKSEDAMIPVDSHLAPTHAKETLSAPSWVVGFQKVVKLSMWDSWRLWFDTR